jgi:hypothetical protein
MGTGPVTAGALSCVTSATAALAAVLLVAGCTSTGSGPAPALASLPPTAEFCLAAERVVTRTELPMQVEVHADFDSFVKSKAVIEGPTLQQFEWRDADGRLLAISCKLKSADHLVATYGPGTAGPDGACQDMNRAIYTLVAGRVGERAYGRVVFDPQELVVNEEQPGMSGPDWLAPFTLTSVDPDGALRVHTKGFIVGFLDPQFAGAPVRFRGIHYCHFIAPGHLEDLLAGRAAPGVTVGQVVDTSGPPPR